MRIYSSLSTRDELISIHKSFDQKRNSRRDEVRPSKRLETGGKNTIIG